MNFTPEVAKKIVEKFNQNAPEARCSLCKNDEFTLVNGFVSLNAYSRFPQTVLVEPQIVPSAALVCTTCGNTFLINLIASDLQDLLDS
jgi:hypothetical protein